MNLSELEAIHWETLECLNMFMDIYAGCINITEMRSEYWEPKKDLENAGLVVDTSLAVHLPAFRFTFRGKQLADMLEKHMQSGGRYSNFNPKDIT